MKLTPIFYSPTGTSGKIAKTIISGIKENSDRFSGLKAAAIDLTHTGDDFAADIRDSIAVISAPVYGGRLSETASRRLKGINGKGSMAFAVVLYGNRDYEDALVELADMLVENGFGLIGAAAFVGEHSYSRENMPIAEGRPDTEDLEKAWNLGKDIAAVLDNLTGSPEEFAFPLDKIKGNRPYKELKKRIPQAPLTAQDKCTGCGLCESVCPVGAISIKGDTAFAEPETCTGCCACVKSCPQNALSYDTPFTDYLFRNFSARKEPEIFMQARN